MYWMWSVSFRYCWPVCCVMLLQVITFLHTVLFSNELPRLKTALVLCPLGTVSNWLHEFAYWTSRSGKRLEAYALPRQSPSPHLRACELRVSNDVARATKFTTSESNCCFPSFFVWSLFALCCLTFFDDVSDKSAARFYWFIEVARAGRCDGHQLQSVPDHV